MSYNISVDTVILLLILLWLVYLQVRKSRRWNRAISRIKGVFKKR
jgi:hypothetical protein